jgi:putative phosphonate catabolism associated alcohol dehydrogenase
VEATGSPALCDLGGEPLQPGDRVTWSVAVSCGKCDRCEHGLPQKCRSLSKYGHELCAGRDALSGGLAERILLRRGTAVIRIPPDLPAEVICPVSCATATVAAACRKAGDVSACNVLIFGAGMLGMTAAAMANSQNAQRVVVCDIDPARLEQVKHFGADATVEWTADIEELRAGLAADSGIDSFDVVLELSGSPDAVEAACRLAGVGGRIVLVGSVMKSRAVQIDPESVVRRCLSIDGVHNYAPQDLQTAVDFLIQNHAHYPFAELVRRTYPLTEINLAIETALEERPVRVAIRP